MVSSRWAILAILFLARTFMAWQFQTLGALGALVVADLAIDYTRLGTLVGLYMLPGIFIALPGGILGQRFGSKRVVLAGLALMAAGGVLMGMTPSFGLMAVGRLLAGVGAALLNVLLTKMVADWFAGREIATAMAVLVAAWPFGIAIALIVCLPLALHSSWSAVMMLSAAAGVICFAAVALLYREPAGAAAPTAARLRIDLTREEWLLVSLAGLIWGAYNVAYIALVTFVPGFFASRGYAATEAATIASALGWLLIPSIPLGGYVAERSRRQNLVIGGSCAVLGLLLVALPLVDAPVLVFAAVAVVFGLPAGCIMALPAEVLRPQARGAGMGVYFSWYYAAMALLPGLAGLARDVTGESSAPILVAAAFLFLALAIVIAFRLRVAGAAKRLRAT